MPSKPISIGSKIEARCTKCRKNCEHVLVSSSDGHPDQVQCRICDRQHKYRPPTKAKKVSWTLIAEKKAADTKKWEQLSVEAKSVKARAYSMNEDYRTNTLINHPTFGIGIVQRVIGSRKMEILFEAGLKTMRCK